MINPESLCADWTYERGYWETRYPSAVVEPEERNEESRR
jgi:hypothetical protein